MNIEHRLARFFAMNIEDDVDWVKTVNLSGLYGGDGDLPKWFVRHCETARALQELWRVRSEWWLAVGTRWCLLMIEGVLEREVQIKSTQVLRRRGKRQPTGELQEEIKRGWRELDGCRKERTAIEKTSAYGGGMTWLSGRLKPHLEDKKPPSAAS